MSMAATIMQTPKQRTTGLQRPSFSHMSTTSSPSLRASTTDINRKASLQALTGQNPRTPANKMGEDDLEVGDAVNVPGDMYGTVKFVGSVRGKSGRFVGVELAAQFAARGKNDGDVDGVQYFNTTVAGSGIFLPVHRAERRLSPTTSEPFLGTPTTPSRSTYGKPSNLDTTTTTTPAIKPKFSQSVGPGARPPSPSFKPKRPSLPRPESPLRKGPALAPTPARGLSQSQMGSRPSIGQTPSKAFKTSTTTRPPPVPSTARPYSRNGSRMGHRADTIDENEVTTRGMQFSQTMRSPSRQGGVASNQDAEIQRLRAQLTERDQRLNEQQASLAEMEQSVKELSALLPADGTPIRSPGAGEDDDNRTATQLRQMLREKNEKISKLTAEFDAHRADFRSTLDSLEMASTETERVYEEQKRDLLAQLAEMQEVGQSKEDFEGVAQQLKQLEELVAELEEGLEESRRGEAEARGEVEFLRGEVERGRSELRREREKAAAAMKHASVTSSGSSIKDLEQRDDEIRGLKAIIHSLSEAGHSSDTKATSLYSAGDDDELRYLKQALEDVRLEKESLENEVEQLHRERAYTNGNAHIHARNESEMTEKALNSDNNNRPRSNTIKASPLLANGRPTTAKRLGENGGSFENGLFCEMCESADHDTLECTKLGNNTTAHVLQQKLPAQQDVAAAATTIHQSKQQQQQYDLGKENRINGHAEPHRTVNTDDTDKWCALCERDGHLAFDCPEEQY